MKRVHQIAEGKGNRALTDYLAQHGPLLLPMVGLISSAQPAVEEFMDVGAGPRWTRCWSCRPSEWPGRASRASRGATSVARAARRAPFAFPPRRSVSVSLGCGRRPAVRGRSAGPGL